MNKVWTLFGTGAHARKAFHIAVLCGDSVAAFVDEQPDAQAPVPGVRVVSSLLLAATTPGDLFVAIGRPEVRRRLMDAAAAAGWRLPSLVHPSASVAPDAVLGEGVMVAAGAVVESGAMVAAGAVVTPRKIVRSGELWAGNPAQKLRDITEKDLEMFRRVVGHYIELANAHRPVEQKAAE